MAAVGMECKSDDVRQESVNDTLKVKCRYFKLLEVDGEVFNDARNVL